MLISCVSVEYASSRERYQEESSGSSSSQLHRMLRTQQQTGSSAASYTEPSPPSHDSSPHMGHASPQLSHHNSPQNQMSQGKALHYGDGICFILDRRPD